MKETFGQRFQKLRKAKNLTQEDIASKFDVSPQAVSKWENDISYPDITILTSLSDILGITTDELLGKEKKPQHIIQTDNNKNPKDMILKMVINEKDGDKVKMNVPLNLLKLGIHTGMQINVGKNKEVFKDIDFEQIIEMAEKGLIGKLLEVETADGTTVDIFIE